MPDPTPPAPGVTPDELLRTGQVALLFNVDPKTVTRWCNDGLLAYIRTPGGQRKIPLSAVEHYLRADQTAGGAA